MSKINYNDVSIIIHSSSVTALPSHGGSGTCPELMGVRREYPYTGMGHQSIAGQYAYTFSISGCESNLRPWSREASMLPTVPKEILLKYWESCIIAKGIVELTIDI